ncbi:WlaTC/HtrL family glycosyltransferase, partial [Peribacillus psychrosaccharolyticus]
NICDIEPEVYNAMKQVSENQWFLDYRILPNATSNIAKYSYLMLLKSYFLADAVKRGLTKKQVAWIDFGFNHGGDLYTNPEQFDFMWEYEFSNKIQFFYYKKYDEKPIFEIVRRLSDCIMGCLIVTPSNLCEELWKLNKEAMLNLNKVGLSDDDQLIQLMSFRAKPEIFELHQSEWFLPLKEYGGSHLTIKSPLDRSKYRNILSNGKAAYKKRKNAFNTAVKTYKNLVTKV